MRCMIFSATTAEGLEEILNNIFKNHDGEAIDVQYQYSTHPSTWEKFSAMVIFR